MKSKDDPSSPKVTYEYYRVTKATYRKLGAPVERRPKDSDLIRTDILNKQGARIARRGGKVICTVKQGVYTGIGVAVCSYSDMFHSTEGRNRATDRAMDALRFCKELDAPPTVSVTITFGPTSG